CHHQPGAGLDEEDDDGDDEGVDRDSLGKRRTDDHRGADIASGFRVASEGIHGTADRESDTEGRAKPANPNSDRGCESAYGISISNSTKHVTSPPAGACRPFRRPRR